MIGRDAERSQHVIPCAVEVAVIEAIAESEPLREFGRDPMIRARFADICDHLRREIERKTNLMVGALEPILTISLASAIAVVLLAIYLPMFDMVNTISK